MQSLRTFVFYAVFLVVLLVYLGIYPPYLLNHSYVSVYVIGILISWSPILTGDISVFGEYTPPVLAGLMASVAPPRTKTAPFVIAVLLAFISYLLYIQLTVFFSEGPGGALLTIDNENAASAKQTMTGLVASIRTFCIVVAAGLIGFKINPNLRSETPGNNAGAGNNG